MSWNKVCLSVLVVLVVAGVMPSHGYSWTGAAGLALNASASGVTLEQELVALTNRTRTAQGLPILEMDAVLMKLAQSHAVDMARQGFISHDLPSGNINVRMNRIGYNYETVRENVAQARTVSYAHSALMQSPGHKANILAADVTRIGIGVVRDPVCGKYLFIAEIFATPRENYDPSQIKQFLTTKVEKLRENGSVIMVPKLDPVLDNMATTSLQNLSNSYSHEDLRNLLARSAGELRKSGKDNVGKIEVSVQVLSTPEKLSIPAALRQGVAEIYGAAVRKIKDGSDRPAFLVLTLTGVSR
ncbi:MAG: CAP domain-containing protein [Acidobacteriota bacterium]|nr:CAP domain-containing protein [Acidobacteriota bacterium]